MARLLLYLPMIVTMGASPAVAQKAPASAPATDSKSAEAPVKKEEGAPPAKELSEAEKTENAKAAFEKAQTAFNLGDFKNALASFKEAYALMNHPALLFNIGQTHKELGEHKQAIFFFEAYLQNMGDQADKELANQLIQESRTALEAQKAELKEQRELEKSKARDEALAKEVEASKKREAELAKELEKEREDEGVADQWWFWPTVGGASVVAVTALGATALIVASLNAPAEEETCGSLGCIEAQ
jgi:tetratricopeptide (TPR) repeat protein